MSHTRFASVALACCFFATLGHAASFDCTRAASQIEELICGDSQLSKLDNDLAVAYAQALKQTSASVSLIRQQRGWLGNVRNHCTTVECLKNAYTLRTAQLGWIKKPAQPAPGVALSEDATNCDMLADYTNRGTLKTLAVYFLATQAGDEYLKTIFGDDVSSDGFTYWHVDLNNDGVPDHLAIAMDGSARLVTVYARSGKKGSEVATLPEVDFWAIGGRYYFSDGDKVWRMTHNGDFKKVCGFSVRKHFFELVKGQQSAVCQAAAQGRFEYVQYSLGHQLKGLPDNPRFTLENSQDLKDGDMARADIDNDGKLDNIVKVDYMRRGRLPCMGTNIAVTNANATTIPDTRLNQLLLNSLGGESSCRSLDTFFVYKGTTYLDARRSSSTDGKIYRIKETKVETICEFEERILVDAIVDE